MRSDAGHVVVTGASSGIGRAIAQALLAAGWRITGLDVAQASIVHGSYTHMPVDLSDGAAPEAGDEAVDARAVEVEGDRPAVAVGERAAGLGPVRGAPAR